jgi:hypothetical protein
MAGQDEPIGTKMVTPDTAMFVRVRRFLDAYTAQRRGLVNASPAPKLLAFLEKARPLLRRTGAQPAKETHLPPRSPAQLKATLAILREPLRQALARGDLMQVWAVAGLKRNEVRNAAVLAWFLDPRGSHGFGPDILRRFLALAAEKAPEWPTWSGDLATAHVCTEERPLGSERDRVDIAIDGEDFCFFVEVKIDAPEGRDQISRYLEALREKAQVLRKQHVGVIYLSSRPASTPAQGFTSLTWRHVAKLLSEAPESGIAGALARQYAQHVRMF